MHLSKNKFKSAGEAAYAAAAERTGCSQPWPEANQEKWEEAAAAAIMFGRQHAAEAQVAFFKTGACVPYDIDEDGNLFTAQLVAIPSDTIEIRVNSEFIRHIRCADMDSAINEFADIVMAPPGFVIA